MYIKAIYDKLTANIMLFTHSVMSLCNPMNCSKPGFTVLHYLRELAQTHVH